MPHPAARPPRLFERDAELRAIDAAVAAAAGGAGRLLIAEGPGGIGKSRLLAEGRERAAAAGMRVLAARCSELERSFPFGAVRQLFAPLLIGAEADERAARFGGAAAHAAPLLEEAVTDASAPSDDLFARLHGLYWLVANVSGEGPLLLVVDDVHWADEASIRFLEFLGRRLADLPVLLLLGSRPADEPTAEPAVSALLADPEAQVLRPAPLSREAVSALVAGDGEQAADPAFAAACHEATGGNPFLLGELVTEIADEGLAPAGEAAERVRSIGPSRVATVVLLRLRRLAPASIELARALAILGDGIDVRACGAFAGLEEADAVSAAELLEGAGVADAEAGLRFVHPIVRQAVYQDLSAVQRGERHAAAAAFLAERGAPADAVAAHLLHAPPGGARATVATLCSAAARAEALGDPMAAFHYLARALAEPPRPDERAAVLLAYGRAGARAGRPEAVEALEECLAVRPDPEVLGEATVVLADLRVFSGRPELAVDVIEDALRVLGEESEAGRELVGSLISVAHVGARMRERLLPRLRRFTDPGGPARTLEELRALAVLAGLAIMDDNDGPAGSDYARRAAALPLSAPVPPEARGSLFVVCTTLMAAEEFAASERVLGVMLEEATAAGAQWGIVSVRSLRALVRYRMGAVVTAEVDALTALEMLPEAHGAEMMAHAATGAAVLAGLELERPTASLQRLLDQTPYHRDPDILPFSQILLAQGLLSQREGDHDRALQPLLACDRPDAGWGGAVPSLIPWRSAAAASLAVLGRRDEALALAEEEVRLARAAQLPRATGMAEHALAVLQVPEDRLPALEQAVASSQVGPAPLDLARALVDLAAERRRLGDRAGARADAERAHDLAAGLGATRTARLARQELRAVGARPRTTAGQGVAGLTPAERRVADLAAAGRTNREIAQALFVSEKTVETHLARVFRKLDVSSRRQLPQLLGA